MKLQRNQSGKRQWTMLAPLLVLIGVLWFTPLTASAQGFLVTNNLNNIPVTGIVGRAGTFAGNLTILGISPNGQRVFVDGLLNGVAVTLIGRLINPQGVCDVLFLDINPIFLDLLGAQVRLDRVTLDIDAVAAPGNLLGNLLCAIVHLLD